MSEVPQTEAEARNISVNTSRYVDSSKEVNIVQILKKRGRLFGFLDFFSSKNTRSAEQDAVFNRAFVSSLREVSGPKLR